MAQAWKRREPGGLSFGLGHAVAGHHRIGNFFLRIAS